MFGGLFGYAPNQGNVPGPPPLLLNPGAGNTQTVREDVTFTNNVTILQRLQIPQITTGLIATTNLTYIVPNGFPAIIPGTNVAFNDCATGVIILPVTVPPAPPIPPPIADIGAQLPYSPNTYVGTFRITNVPNPFIRTLTGSATVKGFQTAAGAAIVADIPYFTAMIRVNTDPANPGVDCIAHVSACYNPPVLAPNAVPPPVPPFIYVQWELFGVTF